jgi:transcriptional regulator GlxA family with amidase domain
MDVALLVADRATDAGVAIALNVLATANRLAHHQGGRAPFSVRACSTDGAPRQLASGLELGGLGSADDAREAAALIVPGAWLERPDEVGPWLESRDARDLADLVADRHGGGTQVLGSCSGSFLLAQAGVLDGLEATTAWWLAPELARRFPRVRVDATQALIAHPRVATAGAVLAQADLALHLVRTVAGPALARDVARYLLLDEHPGQAPYMALRHLLTDDPLLQAAERQVRTQPSAETTVPSLARAIGTSPRTLARRVRLALGLSPGQWIRHLRLEEAARLLETSTLPVEQVAERAGFGSASSLRRELQHQRGLSPLHLRRQTLARLTPAPTTRREGLP